MHCFLSLEQCQSRVVDLSLTCPSLTRQVKAPRSPMTDVLQRAVETSALFMTYSCISACDEPIDAPLDDSVDRIERSSNAGSRGRNFDNPKSNRRRSFRDGREFKPHANGNFHGDYPEDGYGQYGYRGRGRRRGASRRQGFRGGSPSPGFVPQHTPVGDAPRHGHRGRPPHRQRSQRSQVVDGGRGTGRALNPNARAFTPYSGH